MVFPHCSISIPIILKGKLIGVVDYKFHKNGLEMGMKITDNFNIPS